MTTQYKRPDTWFHTGDPTEDKPIWYQHPERTPLKLEDLKHHCSNICRYNGGLVWRLIQHLALGVELCKVKFGEDYLATMIAGYYAAHDLHEAVVGDMVSGMKKYVPEYNRMERMWEEHVHNQIGLPLELSLSKKTVHELDMMSLVVEMTALIHPAAKYAVQGTGITPEPEWIDIFWEVHALSDDECWAVITNAINKAREEVPNGRESSN